ncbi:uncharacterized protein LOC107366939 [Tetranychus urticae]|uniref:Uncharacterized protein n=1 Tax=Tetranychus urticae TaxID=32264 RepID=T1KSU2_TETUR|nr:uncharacterized protein LOC107366939 [Tetranychus urticae]
MQLQTFIWIPLLVISISSIKCDKSSSQSSTKGSLLTVASPLMKSLIKETLAYMAAPLFMPIAIGRTLRSPPGLGPDGSPVQRFARYLFKLATMKKNDAEEQLKSDLFDLLTTHRRNIVLTMKQYRELERSSKAAKSLRKNHRKAKQFID